MRYEHGGMHFQYPEAMDFSININPFGMPESVKKAAFYGIEESVYYPEVTGNRLKEKIASYESDINKNVTIEAEQIVLGNGAADLIYQVCLAIRPANALIVSPTFQEYEKALSVINANVRFYEMKKETDYQLDHTFLEQCTKDIDMIFLCNPNNPTGQLIDRSLLESIVTVCNQNNCLLFLDECFMDFCEKKISLIDTINESSNVFILKAFTKAYAMPGLRLGYGISSNRRLIHKIEKSRQPWSISMPAQYAGMAALDEIEFVRNTARYMKKEQEYLIREIRRNELVEYLLPTNTNYIFFKAEPFLNEELLKKGFILRDCSNFKFLEKGYYRMAIRTHEDNEKLIRAWKEIKIIWQK